MHAVQMQFQQGNQLRVVEVGFLPIEQARGAKGVVFIAGDVTEREQLREELARRVAVEIGKLEAAVSAAAAHRIEHEVEALERMCLAEEGEARARCVGRDPARRQPPPQL